MWNITRRWRDVMEFKYNLSLYDDSLSPFLPIHNEDGSHWKCQLKHKGYLKSNKTNAINLTKSILSVHQHVLFQSNHHTLFLTFEPFLEDKIQPPSRNTLFRNESEELLNKLVKKFSGNFEKILRMSNSRWIFQKFVRR